MADYFRVREAVRSPAVPQHMQHAFLVNRQLLDQAARSPALCVLALRSLVGDVLTDRVPNTQGPNRVSSALAEGRVFAQINTGNGVSCQFGDGGKRDGGADAAAAATTRTRVAVQGTANGTALQSEQPNVTGTTIRVALPQDATGATLTYGMTLYSPLYAIMRNEDVSWTIILFYILAINFLSVSVLVPLLVKRIKRAEETAAAWTLGHLDERINDKRHDEFGRLSQSFDHMADALSGVINGKIALAAADERSRLARDLHDTAKQRAFALGLQLTALRQIGPDDTRWQPITAASLALVSHLQKDLAEVNRRLATPTIAESGFRHALMEAADALFVGSGIRWQLSMDDDDADRLAAFPLIARQLLFIAVEASANALKHSRAKNMTYSFQRADGTCRWSIQDDGIGFNIATLPAGQGMGLSNMRARTGLLKDGSFVLNSSATGTSIVVTFALDAAISI